MIEATIIVPLLIVAGTQIVKKIAPAVEDWITILVALAVGVVVALVDQFIGVTDISIAQGLVLALSAVGINILANKASGTKASKKA